MSRCVENKAKTLQFKTSWKFCTFTNFGSRVASLQESTFNRCFFSAAFGEKTFKLGEKSTVKVLAGIKTDNHLTIRRQPLCH